LFASSYYDVKAQGMQNIEDNLQGKMSVVGDLGKQKEKMSLFRLAAAYSPTSSPTQ
jgi:hypothetical protein